MGGSGRNVFPRFYSGEGQYGYVNHRAVVGKNPGFGCDVIGVSLLLIPEHCSGKILKF